MGQMSLNQLFPMKKIREIKEIYKCGMCKTFVSKLQSNCSHCGVCLQ